MIEDALSSKLPMAIGKFLIPEFCKELSFTISDLQKLRPLIDNLDEKDTKDLQNNNGAIISFFILFNHIFNAA